MGSMHDLKLAAGQALVSSGPPLAFIAIALAVLVGAAPSALGATRTKVYPAQTSNSFVIKGTNHYYVEFKAVPEGRGGAATVSVEASFERYKDEFLDVTYSTRGRIFDDGGFEARFPGIGRVKVHFKNQKTARSTFDGGPDCPAEVITTRRGVFVGSATFHGKAGFTMAKARRADGQTRHTTRQVCQVPIAAEERPAPDLSNPILSRSAMITVSGQSGPVAVTFHSIGSGIDEPGIGAGGLPTIDFEATYKSRLRGMGVTGYAYVDSGGSEAFSVPAPVGALTDATIAPPKPFSGSGTFHLENPTTASWTGDLAVAIPGVGAVPLTGPGITAQLCEVACAPAPAAR
jgi:hypothetical protein